MGKQISQLDSAITVVASRPHDEADYLRDYDAFKREILARP